MNPPATHMKPRTSADLEQRVRAKIRELVSELQWPIEVRTSEEPVPTITCNPFRKVHIVHMPERFGPLDALHEVIHAWLCERVHPIFGTVVIDGQTDESTLTLFMQHESLYTCAQDWFVDHWLIHWFPEEYSKTLKAYLRVLKLLLARDPGALRTDFNMACPAGLLFAEVHRAGIEAEVPDQVWDMYDSFRRIDPSRPSAAAMLELLNSLADQLPRYGGPQLVFQLSTDKEIHNLIIREVETCTVPRSASSSRSAR